MNSTLTTKELNDIIDAADEIITVLAGTNDDIHPDDSKKLCSAWDDLNDRYAPPAVVKALAQEVLFLREQLATRGN